MCGMVCCIDDNFPYTAYVPLITCRCEDLDQMALVAFTMTATTSLWLTNNVEVFLKVVKHINKQYFDLSWSQYNL